MMNQYSHYETLSPDRMNIVRCELKHLKAVLIDEISLIGNKFFNFINLCLKDIKCSTTNFGGIHIIVFGDLFKLPPVKDNWIFTPFVHGQASVCPNLWLEEFSMFELNEIMRQKDDQA